MQELGSPTMLLIAFGLIAIALSLSWFLDKKYESATFSPFVFPEDGEAHLEAIEVRRQTAKTYARIWWIGTIVQIILFSIGGYLIFSIYGAISFLIIFGFFRLTSGILFFRLNLDTLSVFEKTLEVKAATIPFTEFILKQEINRCIDEGLLRKEEYERLLLYLGNRPDIIGSVAQKLFEESSL